MQPLPGLDTNLILRIKGTALSERAVNSEEWWRQQTGKIRPDEIFFHRYFVAKEEKEVKVASRKRKRGDEEMDEDEIWSAIVKSSKEEGGVGDVDVDVDGSDEEVVWSSEEGDEMDDEELAEMNEPLSDEEMEDMDVDDHDENEISDEEADVEAFFENEAEEVEGESDQEEDEEDEDEDEDADESDGSNMEGRFEFGDDESDVMNSEDEIDIPVRGVKSDKSKKRKLKSLPTFASAEDYADMLEE